MKKKVFIDGREGTTGLRIYDRLAAREDIELIVLSEDERKSPKARREAINASDLSFLCLPDDAAREAVSMCENPDTVIIDTSTAHRTDPRFVYAFPELSDEQMEAVASSKRISVPGCHACGFIALVRPLIEAGIISKGAKLSCFSLTGYSGGGKKTIAQYGDPARDPLLAAPRQYALSQNHKHLKEMKHLCSLENFPVFCPIICDFYSGMEVTVPLFASEINASREEIEKLYEKLYSGEVVKYEKSASEDGYSAATALSGKDSMQITVHGNDERILLVARYDNLGKGASGAAVQCMNIVTGADMKKGLVL